METGVLDVTISNGYGLSIGCFVAALSARAVTRGGSVIPDVSRRCVRAEDAALMTRTGDVFRWATELVGPESEEALSDSARLSRLRALVEDFVTGAATTPEHRAEALALLAAIHRVQGALLGSALDRQLGTLSDIHDTILALSGLSLHELIHAVPARATRVLSLGRAMLSTVNGSVWLPQHLHIEDRSAESADFEEYVDGARIPLSDAPLETEMLIRRRRAALVPDPGADVRTFKQIVDVARTRAYVAAPITLAGRTVGMLHADRPDDPTSLSTDDLELMATFAECLSIVFESAMLQRRMQLHAERVAATFADLASMVDRIDKQPALPYLGDQLMPTRAVRGADPLTAREREVLAHLASGKTNAQIAQTLIVSEGTVKSHLKRISKKLGTSGRAAAVAEYARSVGIRSRAIP
ncbi:MAG TPA: LuxR C-terminal-related transcriptional regulator [Aldersonia sp.]